ncbi:hypothetical protein MYAM1_000626a [Malassezia yamatoensis]|uniref:Pheromone receptor n=1 Tax=Malassezia yamatoensis TaxID=253288 RepID=A0AAJ5YPS8_9BASI|nr:hypothetical protein MYAM1_000626a [Malassezia yamatoensis]
MLDSTVAFIFFAFLSLPALLISLPFHINAQNAGAVMIIVWTTLGTLTEAISAIIMSNAKDITAIHWCDLAGAIKYMWGTGCCMGGLLLLRRLAIIASTESGFKNSTEKTKVFFIEVAIGVTVPLVQILFHLTVQAHRMDEVQDFGCMAPTYPTLATVFLVMLYPIMIELISAIYGQFHRILGQDNSGFTKSQYLRLMALGLIDIALWLPLSLSFLILDLSHIKLLPYSSWNTVHRDFNRVVFVPIEGFLQANHSVYVTAELGRWIGPAVALNLLVFFGLKSEVWMLYRSYLHKAWAAINRAQPSSENSAAILATPDEKFDRRSTLYQPPSCSPLTRDSTCSFQRSSSSSSHNSQNLTIHSIPEVDLEKADHLSM